MCGHASLIAITVPTKFDSQQDRIEKRWTLAKLIKPLGHKLIFNSVQKDTETQRHRDTERQRDRETERQTERQRDRETERQRDRETERERKQKERERERERDHRE